MYVLLKKLGYNSTLISIIRKTKNIKFLKKYLHLTEINNFTDIKKSDYDIIIVDSDEVWAYNFRYLLQIGFLSFAKNWNINKIVYAASIGFSHWTNSSKIINSAKSLINQFSAVSVREKQSIDIIYKYLGIKPQLVLDPTFLIEKEDYLELVKNFKLKFDNNKNYLCSYILDKSKIKNDYVRKVSKILNYSVIDIKVEKEDFIEEFLYSINICKSVITDSYHGTVFSLIFNKPFITFINKIRGGIRFLSLGEMFQIKNRFINPKKFEISDLSNFTDYPNINITNFNNLRKNSLNFLKRNLLITK